MISFKCTWDEAYHPYMVLNRLIIPQMGVDWLTYNWRAITVGMSKYTYSIRLMIVLWGAASKPPNQPPKRWSTVELKPGIETLWQHVTTCDNYIKLRTTSTSQPWYYFKLHRLRFLSTVCQHIYIYYMKNAVRLQVYLVKTCYAQSGNPQEGHRQVSGTQESCGFTPSSCAWTPFS